MKVSLRRNAYVLLVYHLPNWGESEVNKVVLLRERGPEACQVRCRGAMGVLNCDYVLGCFLGAALYPLS